MSEYMKVDVVHSHAVDKYLSEGWEIIETAKFSTDYGQLDTKIDYHMGLPARVMVQKLTSIIKDYEEYGLKEKLFNGIAESNNEKVEDYEAGLGHPTNSKIAKYIEVYERLVNNQIVEIRKKYTQEELEEMHREVEF